MLPEKTNRWGRSRSCIRTLFEYGTMRKAEIGSENVFDFSLGNPSIPSPQCVNDAIIELAQTENVTLHGYTTAAGILPLREKIAADLNEKTGLHVTADSIYVTCGAAASLTICLKAILFPGDEVIVPAPFFPEYRVFTEAVDGKVVVIPPRDDMQMDLDGIKAALGPKTKALILNSPNNPSGVVFDEENMKGLAKILKDFEAATGQTVYVLSDEPYRELVYDMDKAPCILEYYDDCFQCYSFSKVLSVPGERIGYIAVSDRMKDAQDVYYSIMGAGRALGYVNPPSLFQKVILKCFGATSDIEQYKINRDILCKGLAEIGYEFANPAGAFYLFVKALEPDAQAFSEHAKKHELLIVPSDDFGCPGYVRIAYCVSKEMIERSMPAFKALYDEYNGGGK